MYYIRNKTGVINDLLGQPTIPAGSDCRLILKFCDGRTDTLCENSDHYRPGLPRGSINNTEMSILKGDCDMLTYNAIKLISTEHEV